MKVEKLSITYGQDLREETGEDGKVTKVPVEGTGTTDDVFVKHLKRRKRAALFTSLKGDVDDVKDAPASRQTQFAMEMIAESLCDENGKPVVSVDDLDDPDNWPDAKFNAYSTAIVGFQSPKVESIAKNSSSTTTVAA